MDMKSYYEARMIEAQAKGDGLRAKIKELIKLKANEEIIDQLVNKVNDENKEYRENKFYWEQECKMEKAN